MDLDDGAGGRFPQAVPVATLQDGQIVTGNGFDCPLAPGIWFFSSAEKRGLGVRDYHVVGYDRVIDRPLGSVGGRIGSIGNRIFTDVATPVLYFDIFSIPWHLQKTAFSYFEAVDRFDRVQIEGGVSGRF